ncbi:MAG: hypothetical protein ACPGF6_07445, partial [Porticoccaceae bacterium]
VTDTWTLSPKPEDNLIPALIFTAHRHKRRLVIDKLYTLYSSQDYTTIANIPSGWINLCVDVFYLISQAWVVDGA